MTSEDRQTTHVCSDAVDIRDCDGRSVNALINVLQKLLDDVPAHYKDQAILDIDVDEYRCDLQVRYQRPETDEEKSARLSSRRRSIEREYAHLTGRCETLKRLLEKETP